MSHAELSSFAAEVSSQSSIVTCAVVLSTPPQSTPSLSSSFASIPVLTATAQPALAEPSFSKPTSASSASSALARPNRSTYPTEKTLAFIPTLCRPPSLSKPSLLSDAYRAGFSQHRPLRGLIYESQSCLLDSYLMMHFFMWLEYPAAYSDLGLADLVRALQAWKTIWQSPLRITAAQPCRDAFFQLVLANHARAGTPLHTRPQRNCSLHAEQVMRYATQSCVSSDFHTVPSFAIERQTSHSCRRVHRQSLDLLDLEPLLFNTIEEKQRITLEQACIYALSEQLHYSCCSRQQKSNVLGVELPTVLTIQLSSGSPLATAIPADSLRSTHMMLGSIQYELRGVLFHQHAPGHFKAQLRHLAQFYKYDDLGEGLCHPVGPQPVFDDHYQHERLLSCVYIACSLS